MTLEAGPAAHLAGREGVAGAAGHRPSAAAVAQTLLAGAGRTGVDDGAGGQRVRCAGLPADLASEARGLVDLS